MARAASKISPARSEAFAILFAVENGQGHSDGLLRSRSVARLSPQDKNLATALVLGVLRWQLALDARIRPLLKRPNAKLDTEVLIALRLGAFQLLHLDRIPAHAAIDESVELTRAAGHRFASSMVNAVLRKLAASTKTAVTFDTQTAYPAWMMERWIRFFGLETTQAICSNGVTEPEINIRISGSTDEAELAQEGVTLAPGQLLTASRAVLTGDIAATTAFREGLVRIQDEGSQLIAEIAGQGSVILDACAAPGGKTLILAERNPQSRIVAYEVNKQRASSLRKRLASFVSHVECREADAAALTENNAYDLALVDAPCSGTGTLARNPEIRHRLQPEEFARQAKRQKAILAAALRAVKPGTRIVYSTCSLEPEENEQVIAVVAAENPGVRVAPLHARIKQMRNESIVTPHGAETLASCFTPEGYLRLFPSVHGTDGFFIAQLEKFA